VSRTTAEKKISDRTLPKEKGSETVFYQLVQRGERVAVLGEEKRWSEEVAFFLFGGGGVSFFDHEPKQPETKSFGGRGKKKEEEKREIIP